MPVVSHVAAGFGEFGEFGEFGSNVRLLLALLTFLLIFSDTLMFECLLLFYFYRVNVSLVLIELSGC